MNAKLWKYVLLFVIMKVCIIICYFESQAYYYQKSPSKFHRWACPPSGTQHGTNCRYQRQRQRSSPAWLGRHHERSKTRREFNGWHDNSCITNTISLCTRHTFLNIGFKADWEFIKERKQKRITANNVRENKSRREHTHRVGDKVMIDKNPNRKHGSDRWSGPHTITKVNDNGTIQLEKGAPNGGAVQETWNIRNVDPCKAWSSLFTISRGTPRVLN